MKANLSYTDLRFGQFYLHVSIKASEMCKMLQGNILRTPYGGNNIHITVEKNTMWLQ